LDRTRAVRSYEMSLKQKSALITGASRGIGRGIALKLAEEGAKIGVHYYRNESAAKNTLEEIRKRGSDGFIVQADVCKPDDITRIAISPGWTENSVLNSLPDQVQNLIRNWHKSGWTPMGRLGTPEDIGNVVALFCSEQAGWITGQVIYADGGASLMTSDVPPEIQFG